MTEPATTMDDAIRTRLADLEERWRSRRAGPRAREVGYVAEVGNGVARVTGLLGVRSDELLYLADGAIGLALDLREDGVGCVLLDAATGVVAGSEVRRGNRVLDVPVGDELIGRVVDPIGRPLDGGGPIRTAERRRLEPDAPSIPMRAPVTVPLQTGLKVVDALIPIGRGQRELILGDRQTGKTAIALDTIVNQRETGVLCVYCAIAQRSTSVARVVDLLRSTGAIEYTTVVVGEADCPAGLQFVAPYAATSIAEHLMHTGRDVLVVYDDLTAHARAYRELSLLLRRPPGREAFPGDVFYLHSRLLERSTHLRPEFGGGSLTALPIAETEAQNVSAYIPTNLISITDGQIALSPQLFQRGVLPAVDVGRSVSRVGGRTQRPAFRAVAGDLRLSYTQFEELEKFARFSSQLDESTRRALDRGRQVREVLKQGELAPLAVARQIAILVAVTRGVFDDLPIERLGAAQDVVADCFVEEEPELCQRIEAGDRLLPEEVAAITIATRRALTGLTGTTVGTEGSRP